MRATRHTVLIALMCGASLAGAGARDAAAAASSSAVRTEAGLRAAWADPQRTRIDLGADIVLRDCTHLEPIRESPYPMLLDGHGHTLRQTCFEHRLLRQDGTGFVGLRHVTLTRGGADGPGAGVTTRGELSVVDGTVTKNLSEEPGGALFSMRRVTVRGSHINGNLANDDGGGIYARRGGVRVYDSVLSNNLVDGSGGAVGSTGDILVVRSEIDGNTTDGDGGALYADDDGDITVIRSVIDGSDADGPGGAIFTVDGDVAVYDSTLIGNRADDRGGAISGEADVLVVNSTVARNLAVAHAGGGIWARGDLVLINSTITDNYAEGEGGGVLAAGRTWVLASTISANIASVAANLGSAGALTAAGSIIGPAKTDENTGDARPTRRSCRVYKARSAGWNLITDPSCELTAPTDLTTTDPGLRRLEDDPKGYVLTPFDSSPARDRIPATSCRPVLPAPLPAGQLLAAHVNWPAVLSRDARGTSRMDAGPCDVGAVESPTRPAEPPVVMPPPVAAPAAARRVAAEARVRRARAATPAAAAAVAAPSPTLARRVADLDRASRRFDRLRGCLTELPVDRAGDPAHRFGFRYDERDGTGIDTRPALVRHRRAGRADLRLLVLSRRPGCLSAAIDPTDSSGVAARAADRHRLAARIRRIERRVARFDAWTSCLTTLPVTQSGDPDQNLGYLRGARHDAAIDLDTSARDDPDYELLAFAGTDRPSGRRSCHHAKPAAAGALARHALVPRKRASQTLADRVADLAEPVGDITRFDQCAFTVGVRERTGFSYKRSDGRRTVRSALGLDLSAPRLPQLDLLAFPGEEPPQIECDEDAGGQATEDD